MIKITIVYVNSPGRTVHHSKNKILVLGNAVLVLGMKLKRR